MGHDDASGPSASSNSPNSRRIVWLRPLVLLALLCLEGLLLGISFDSEALVASSGSAFLRLFAGLLGSASPFFVILAAASLLLGSKAWLRELVALYSARWPRAMGRRVGVQLASFVCLFGASVHLFVYPETAGGLQVALWLIALLATLLCWLALWAPWAVWRPLTLRLLLLAGAGLLLGALAYTGGQFSQRLWEPLRGWTFAWVAILSRVLLPAVQINPATGVIAIGDFSVEVSTPCSGYEGIGLSLVFLLAFFWLFRDRLRISRALTIVLPVLLFVWLLNGLRIATLVVIGARISPELALGGFHSYVGSLLFSGVSLAVLFFVLRIPFFTKTPKEDAKSDGPAPVPPSSENVAASHLLPFLLLVAAALVSATFSVDSGNALYPFRVIAASVALYVYRVPARRFLNRELGERVANSTILKYAGTIAILTTAIWVVEAGGASEQSEAFAPLFSEPLVGELVMVAWWLFRIVGTVIVVPLAEELAFRGFVMRRLTSPAVEQVGWSQVSRFALIAQAVLFGVLHPQHLLGGCLAGLAFGWIAQRTRSGSAPFLAHALTNALVLALAAWTKRWDWV